MSLSVHQVAVPTFTRMLKNLSAILQKGLAHAEAKEIDPSVLINSRLALDMLPLVRQIQIATNTAKNAVSELAGVEAPEYEDDEATFADLFARIDKTIDHLETFESEQFDGAETKKVTLKAGETSIESLRVARSGMIHSNIRNQGRRTNSEHAQACRQRAHRARASAWYPHSQPGRVRTS